jgi:hypothetical protein
VVAIDENSTTSPDRTVHRQCHANRQPASAVPQCDAVFSLDDEMQVILLHRKVQHPEATAARAGDRRTNHREDRP